MPKLILPKFFLLLLFSHASLATCPSLADIEDIVTTFKKKYGDKATVEQTIDQIAKKYPKLRRNHVLVHKSLSRQKATAKNPRVISFCPSGNFAFSFNSDSSLPGFFELEMFEFSENPNFKRGEGTVHKRKDYIQRGFKFKRVVFKPAANYKYTATYKDIKSYPHISETNPKLCQGCHGKGMQIRPNWESYNIWEGTYFLKDTKSHGPKFKLYNYDDMPGGNRHALFNEFYTHSYNKGRYKFLKGINNEYLVRPTAEDKAEAPEFDRSTPASRFTQILAYRNYENIVHQIVADNNYDKYKFAVLGALYECKNYPDFFPDTYNPKNSYEYYVKDTRELFSKEKNANYRLLTGDEYFSANLRYLYEGRGMAIRKWSMNKRRPPYSFLTPGGSPGGFISEMLIKEDKSLSPYRGYAIVDYGYYAAPTTEFYEDWTGSTDKQFAKLCADLQVKSLKALSDTESK